MATCQRTADSGCIQPAKSRSNENYRFVRLLQQKLSTVRGPYTVGRMRVHPRRCAFSLSPVILYFFPVRDASTANYWPAGRLVTIVINYLHRPSTPIESKHAPSPPPFRHSRTATTPRRLCYHKRRRRSRPVISSSCCARSPSSPVVITDVPFRYHPVFLSRPPETPAGNDATTAVRV